MTETVKLMLGMGCDRDVSLETLTAAIDQALARIDQTRDAVVGLASIDKKNDERSLLALAEQQGWPLYFFSAAQLAQVAVPNPSEVVRKYMGTPAVAEAAAMLAAQTDVTNLMVEKYKYRGKDEKNATVSIVRMQHE